MQKKLIVKLAKEVVSGQIQNKRAFYARRDEELGKGREGGREAARDDELQMREIAYS